MTAFMEGHDLWEAVESDYDITPLPNNPTLNQIKYHKERITKKAKAKSCLYAAVSPTIFTRIMRCDSVKEIWDFLKKEYEGDEKIRSMKVLNLLREFERQQMKESESVKDYSDKLIEIAESQTSCERLCSDMGSGLF
ncbi:UBN2 domain-containing protein [Cephalotus follicularis]|uniref:UBN2 domain-containing protein n=1 Tax=Cephalotus follicularis TaxID=3775 RepID=A0A1Q3D2J5_CEPFO|nr:UBN2 domain-containing protein [Cephalotus follicularis]